MLPSPKCSGLTHPPALWLQLRLCRRSLGCVAAFASAMLLAGCAGHRPAIPAGGGGARLHALIERSVPASAPDRTGWAADLYEVFTREEIAPTHENVCAVVAVIQQESNFRVDPVVAGLGLISKREIDARAARAGVPQLLVQAALQLKSSNGRSYGDRLKSAATECELSDIFEDFTGNVPLGQRLFASWNPIRTRGPMQVNVAFVERYDATNPYPYPLKTSIADEAFTRRGSLYFGTAHLLAYPAPYDRYLYRFADYNAGQYASRNAAFQRAASKASGILLVTDGALLLKDQANGSGETERALQSLGTRLDLSVDEIHRELERAGTPDFERSPLYERVFAMAERSQGRPLSRALLPQIKLHGPKISRALTTEWYANRVDERFKRCLAK